MLEIQASGQPAPHLEISKMVEAFVRRILFLYGQMSLGWRKARGNVLFGRFADRRAEREAVRSHQHIPGQNSGGRGPAGLSETGRDGQHAGARSALSHRVRGLTKAEAPPLLSH